MDTATPYLVLGTHRLEQARLLDRRHAEELFELLKSFLRAAGLPLARVEGVVVGQGPGSYTGVRIGVAAALGLGRALGVPVVGVDTLAAIAMRQKGLVCPTLPARSHHVYTALYRVDKDLEELEPPRKLADDTLPGPGRVCRIHAAPPSGRALVALGLRALQEGREGINVHYL